MSIQITICKCCWSVFILDFRQSDYEDALQGDWIILESEYLLFYG